LDEGPPGLDRTGNVLVQCSVRLERDLSGVRVLAVAILERALDLPQPISRHRFSHDRETKRTATRREAAILDRGMSVEETTRGGPPGALREGSTFGGFRIERVLGHGGMGIVYLATELRLERQVALKVIRSDLARDDDFRARFRSESKTA